MTTQIVGNQNATTAAEVEVAFKALRVVTKPDDVGALGAYMIDCTSGIMTAGLASNAPVFAWRYGFASNVCVIKQVQIAAGSLAAFTAGFIKFEMFKATGFLNSDTGGTPMFPGAGGKKKSSFPNSLMVSGNNCDIRIALNGALTPGTRTLDPYAIGTVITSAQALAGIPLTPGKQNLFDGRGSNWPLVLAQNEGFIINCIVPATGTWMFDVQVDWLEMVSYP